MLNLVKSNRMEMLMQALAEVTSQVPDDPMAPEWICIQSRGMKQWISAELARIQGISANMTFMFPRQIIQYFLDRYQGGVAPNPLSNLDTLHLDTDTLVWSVMTQLEINIQAGPLAPLASYFQADDTGRKQIQLAKMIASILDDYQVYRPSMLMNWEKGAPPDHPGNRVEKWQSFLWQKIAAAGQIPSLPGQMDALVKAAAARQITDLPHRICLFGLSAVPPSFMAFFSALDTELFMFLLTPSNQFFFDIASPRHMDRLALENRTGSGPDPAENHWEILNPLLASMGRSGRQFHGLLEEGVYVEPFQDLFFDPAAAPGTVSMLCQLQSDILNLVFRHPDGDHPPKKVARDDASICIHACHSPMREAQVLKDLLLDRFEKHPDTALHDVIVMMPDIEAYAPYIEAVFSMEHPISFTISDRRHKTESPAIEAFLKILDLKGSRLEQSRVMDLLLCPAIAEKFEIAPGDIQGLGEMVSRAGILWGLDPDHRRHLTGKGFKENTWQFGLQRLFMGYALPSQAEVLVNDVLPCPFFEGLDAQILGRFTHFCHTLFRHLDALEGLKTPGLWEPVFSALVRDMIAPLPSYEPDIRFLTQTFQSLAKEADAAGFTKKIGFFAARDLVSGKLDQTIAQGGFLAGGVTFCNLMPMRSIPFKVVALMGMDEAAFPRKIFPKSFDLMSACPCPGDKNLRDEDRHLFLETLLSARQQLIITFTGMGIKDNTPVPCSGVVSELADVINQSFTFPYQNQWWVTHRLHPFNPVYFDGTPGFFSYSADQCCIARSRAGQDLSATLPPAGTDKQKSSRQNTVSEPETIELKALHRFFNHPLEMFYKTVLEIVFPVAEEPMPDREPFQVSGLTRYQLGSWVLKKDADPGARVADDNYPLARAGGMLPLGKQGRLEWDAIVSSVRPIQDLAEKLVPDTPLDPVTVDLVLSGSRIWGQVSDLYEKDGGVVRCVKDFGRINARRVLRNWITHLALTLAVPDTPVTTRIIGRDPMGRLPGVVRELLPLGEAAQPCLENMVSMYCDGQDLAWAFFPDTCFLLAQALAKNRYDLSEPALGAAMKKAGPAWFNPHGSTGEKTDRYTAIWCAGRPDPFETVDQLLASGIVDNALAVFKPLFAHLEPGP